MDYKLHCFDLVKEINNLKKVINILAYYKRYLDEKCLCMTTNEKEKLNSLSTQYDSLQDDLGYKIEADTPLQPTFLKLNINSSLSGRMIDKSLMMDPSLKSSPGTSPGTSSDTNSFSQNTIKATTSSTSTLLPSPSKPLSITSTLEPLQLNRFPGLKKKIEELQRKNPNSYIQIKPRLTCGSVKPINVIQTQFSPIVYYPSSNEKREKRIKISSDGLEIVVKQDRMLNGDLGYQCPHNSCSFMTDRMDYIQSHLNKIHIEKRSFICDVQDCGKSFFAEKALKTHIQNIHSPLTHACTYESCDKMFRNENALVRHIESFHQGIKPEKKYKCDYDDGQGGCDKVFTIKYKMEAHKRSVHQGIKPELKFSCDWQGCTYRASTGSAVKVHKNMVHLKHMYNCDWPGCEAQFKSSCYIKQHMISAHSGEKPFICDVCQFCTSNKAVLQRHKLIHTGNKRFQCPQCSMKFYINRALQLHLAQHSNAKPFSCVYHGCDKAYPTKQGLRQHINIIHNKRRLAKKFANNNNNNINNQKKIR